MKVISMKYSWVPVLIWIYLKVVHSQGNLNDDCPDAEDIEPCTCREKIGYDPRTITCQNVYNGDTLRRAFKNAEGYYYKKVIIKDSTLQYIAHEIIEKTSASDLQLSNLILIQIFDSPPQGVHGVTDVMLNNITVTRNISWRYFNGFTNIKRLGVNHTPIKYLGSSFSQYMATSLSIVDFADAKIQKIEPGALSKLVKVERVHLENNGIRNLTRDIFPRPSNITHIDLSYNQITSIPEDMFTDMPKINFLILESNFISILPESAFRGSVVQYLDLQVGNHLKCDCQMKWLLKKELVKNYEGRCESPKRLKRKKLEDLTASDFHCI